jgi:hypothetical protein
MQKNKSQKNRNANNKNSSQPNKSTGKIPVRWNEVIQKTMNRALERRGFLDSQTQVQTRARQYRTDMNVKTEQTERKATYLDSVAVPEYALGAKIPSYSPLPTNAMHMKSTIKFSSNAYGEAALVINPYFLSDANNLYSTILINNSNLLSTANGTGSGNFLCYSQASRLTASTANAYRLVSAALHIYPEVSSMNAQGYIAGGIVTYAGQPDSYSVGTGGYGPFSTASCTASILDQAMYYQKAQIGNQAGIRCIYLPFDPSFEFFCQPNTGRTSLLTTNADQFYWNYYITGSQATTNFVVEIYYNFELEPNPSGVLQLLATSRNFEDNERPLVKEIIKNPEIVSQSNGNLLGTAQAIDSAIRTGSEKKVGFLARAMAWLSENSGNITNIISTGAKVLSSVI